MKFKAVLENEGPGMSRQVMILHVLQAFQRLERALERKPDRPKGAPACIVLKLTADSFSLCHRGGADEGSQTWCHFIINKVFKEFRIESKRENKIDLEAPLANLVHVFLSCSHGEKTTIRLANGRDGRPILGFEFSLSGNATDHNVNQEVPVRVIPEPEAELIVEPPLPEPEFQIELPQNMMRLKNVLEKMRSVGAHFVSVEAALAQAPQGALASESKRVSLRLTAEADLVSIATTFPSLTHVMEGKTSEAPERPVRLQLSLKRLAEVLAAVQQQVSAEANIACLLEDRAFVLYALLPHNNGSLISYTSVVVQ